mmetsp:Transcript_48660/g.130240  ORF Transcript_48660/g.130240 Transcript_48660/m.130240 type:complete len:300 (+) Transcript_48660:541-1440(+)
MQWNVAGGFLAPLRRVLCGHAAGVLRSASAWGFAAPSVELLLVVVPVVGARGALPWSEVCAAAGVASRAVVPVAASSAVAAIVAERVPLAEARLSSAGTPAPTRVVSPGRAAVAAARASLAAVVPVGVLSVAVPPPIASMAAVAPGVRETAAAPASVAAAGTLSSIAARRAVADGFPAAAAVGAMAVIRRRAAQEARGVTGWRALTAEAAVGGVASPTWQHSLGAPTKSGVPLLVAAALSGVPCRAVLLGHRARRRGRRRRLGGTAAGGSLEAVRGEFQLRRLPQHRPCLGTLCGRHRR